MIYFAELETEEQSFVKIGHSKDPERRVGELQLANPLPLSLLLTAPGGREEEMSFHIKFYKQRERGEWFRKEGPLEEYIQEHGKN